MSDNRLVTLFPLDLPKMSVSYNWIELNGHKIINIKSDRTRGDISFAANKLYKRLGLQIKTLLYRPKDDFN